MVFRHANAHQDVLDSASHPAMASNLLMLTQAVFKNHFGQMLTRLPLSDLSPLQLCLGSLVQLTDYSNEDTLPIACECWQTVLELFCQNPSWLSGGLNGQSDAKSGLQAK